MPRQPDGTFQRFNDQYYGVDVWQQDLDTDKKIIALRHDVHDEDLAIGISQCLPKDGTEQMLGHLKMGGFNIRDMANAPNLEPQTAATFGQTVTQMNFNNVTRVLTLVREGMTDLAETIPTDGDTNPIDVGVNELVMGTGLALLSTEDRVNPANPKDTILLANTSVLAGSYSNASFIVDAQGRLTQASSGTAPTSNLGVSQALANTVITNTAGTDATVLPAIATGQAGARSGVMSADQAKALSDASSVVNTNLSFPIHSTTSVTIRSSTQTGSDQSLPRADANNAGIISAADFNKIYEATTGEPDQTLLTGIIDGSQYNIGISKQAGNQTLSIGLSTSLVAGMMSAGQFKQISGLAVDGSGLTQGMSLANDPSGGLNSRILEDHTGADVQMYMWGSSTFDTPLPGDFSGTITNVEPVSTSGVPDHHVWFVY